MGGLDRFKKNLDNLGGYLDDVSLKLRSYDIEPRTEMESSNNKNNHNNNENHKKQKEEENEDGKYLEKEELPGDLLALGYQREEIVMVKASWNFKCLVTLLPWKPLLACKGATKHFFVKETGRIIKHDEGWEIETMDALKQLFKPSPSRKKK